MRSAKRSAGEKPGCCSYHLGQYDAHGNGRRRNGRVLGRANACGGWYKGLAGRARRSRVWLARECNQLQSACGGQTTEVLCVCSASVQAACVACVCRRVPPTDGGVRRTLLSNPPRLFRNRGNQKRREKSARGDQQDMQQSAGRLLSSRTSCLTATEGGQEGQAGARGRCSWSRLSRLRWQPEVAVKAKNAS